MKNSAITLAGLTLLCLVSIQVRGEPLNDLKVEIDQLKKQQAQDQERIKLLETVVKKNKNKLTKRMKRVSTRLADTQQRLKINGFLTASAVYGEKDYGSGTAEELIDLSDGWNYRSDSIGAIQFDYRLSEKVNAVVQVSSGGEGDSARSKVGLSWAYLKFRINDNWYLRAGRLRTGFFIHSESLDVGFTYPWVRPPTELYFASFANVEGLDSNYRFQLGNTLHNIQLLVGAAQERDFAVKDAYSFGYDIEYGSWLFHLNISQAAVDVTIVDVPIFNVSKLRYQAYGVRYDDGVWIGSAEISKLDPIDGGIVSTNNGYLMVGRHFGQWTPHITFAGRRTPETNDVLAPEVLVAAASDNTIEDDADSLTLGLRYELTSKVALKADVTRWFNFKEATNGVITNGSLVSGEPRNEDAHVQVYSFAIDAVF